MRFQVTSRGKGIVVGARVRYSREFCRSIGTYTGPIPFARGIVLSVDTWPSGAAIATVRWENLDDGPERVNVRNLVLSGIPEIER